MHGDGSYLRESGCSMWYFAFGSTEIILTLLERRQHEIVYFFKEILLILTADGDIVIIDINFD